MMRLASAYASSIVRFTSASISRDVSSLNAGGRSCPENCDGSMNAWKPKRSLMP